jgi:hypothetical protein
MENGEFLQSFKARSKLRKKALAKTETKKFLDGISSKVSGLRYKLEKGVPTTGVPKLQIERFKKFYEENLNLISGLKNNPTADFNTFRAIQKRLNVIEKFVNKHYKGVNRKTLSRLSNKYRSQTLDRNSITRNENIGLDKLLRQFEISKPQILKGVVIENKNIPITKKSKKFIGGFKEFINKKEIEVGQAVAQATTQRQGLLLLKTKQKQAQITIQKAKEEIKQKLAQIQQNKNKNFSSTFQKQAEKQEKSLRKSFNMIVRQEQRILQTTRQAIKLKPKVQFKQVLALSVATLQKQAQKQDLTQKQVSLQQQKVLQAQKQIQTQLQLQKQIQTQITELISQLANVVKEINRTNGTRLIKPIKKEKIKKIPKLKRDKELEKKNKIKKKVVKKGTKKKRKTRFTSTLIGSLTGKGVKKGKQKLFTGTERRA